MDTQGKIVKPVNSKLAISKSTSSNTKNVGITTRNMSKKLKESFQMSPFADYSFTKNVASIKVTNATTIEEQLASLMRAIEGLTKHVQEPDAQIAQLINKADNVDASHIMGKQVEAHDEVEASAKQHYTEKDKSKIEGSSKSSLSYSMPYTPRIGSLKMTMGYQPPKFQQFDVKQFVRSLKGNAFDWYNDLEACSIDEWEQLEQEFLNHFYSTRRTVNMPLPSRCAFKGCIGDFGISSKESYPNPLKNWPPKGEVNKLIEVGFIREVTYPMWISSIAPIRKKNGQIQIYVDFRDLNNACPKDDFPLPITELMIDATTGHEALSFMDLIWIQPNTYDTDGRGIDGISHS
ncbi:UNVERIFIED_CONTAM: hypothetical protein Scaly_3037600 [Sesamum calycinum]|uniref:Retrotransposon gag domain-containing protein n=1 Tax=Sesamum calycinum TaxID=2727403 RepID=A0AAW2K771_9LAMI